MNKKNFVVIILLQLVTIVYLVVNIFYNKAHILGVNTVPINKENISKDAQTSPELINYYEPEAGKDVKDKQDWLTKIPTYTINKDSLNERYDYTPEHPDNTFRIITLGDSFTFGEYVNTASNYPESLEDDLNKSCPKTERYEVINLGVAGYDIQYNKERYVRRGQKYSPDLVIWLINDWNFFRINEKLFDMVAKIQKETTDNGTTEERTKKEGRYFAWTEAQNKLVDEVGTGNILDSQLKFFDEFRNKYSGKLVLIVFPDQLNKKGIDEKYAEFISRIKNSANTSVFSEIKYSGLETLKSDPHPNENDYKNISGKLFSYLKDNNLIPCH